MKKILFTIILGIMIISTTGCIKRDTMEDIDIYTSVYPIEYITTRLYGEHATVHSIYPDGIIPDQYTLTDKQIKDYSKSGLFIFNGLSKEKDYILPMRNANKNLRIIDTTHSMEYEYGTEELWLDPSNFLMMAQNVRSGLKEYINNHYLRNDIDENYEQLKIDISNLDAKIQFMMESSDNKVIVVSNDLFKFLEKYNFTVYSLEENENLTEKTVADVKRLIEKKEISYIFMKQNEDTNDTIKKLIEGTDIQLVTLHSITNLSESERNSKKDYITLMNENIELLRNEVFNN